MQRLCGILIAAVAALCCLASAINGQVAQDLLVPFNDLLPPLLEAAATDVATAKVTAPTARTTTRTTTAKPTARATITHRPPTLFKTTKKSHYQQQTQHIKELHLIDDDALAVHDFKQQEQHLQHLLHDDKTAQSALSPPKQLKQPQQQHKLQKQQKFKQALQQSVAQQAQKSKAKTEIKTHQLPLPKVQQPHNNAPSAISSASSGAAKPLNRNSNNDKQQQQQYFQQQQLQHYIDYQFAQTTHRPPNGRLPTLTPFPRHLHR